MSSLIIIRTSWNFKSEISLKTIFPFYFILIFARGHAFVSVTSVKFLKNQSNYTKFNRNRYKTLAVEV